jgi:hypothetical protein
MLRFTVIDEFGLPLRKFATMKEAKAFISNKKGCSIHEYSLDDLLGECLM